MNEMEMLEFQKIIEKNMLYCQKCGAKYSKHFSKCPKCGTRHLQQFYNKWWFWTIIAIVFLVIIVNINPVELPVDTSGNGSNIEKNYVKEPQISEDEYKAACETISYNDLSRNPNNYINQNVMFTGKVVQVQENGTYVMLRIDVTKGQYGIWTDTCYVDYKRKDTNESRILENDIVTFYGTVKGIKNYTAVLGNQISIPHIVAEYIDISQ